MFTGGSNPYDLVDTVFDGRYRILHLLAEGGMSAVYEAEQLNVARRVAVKVLRPEITNHPEMPARFRSEAQIISELRHPNTLKLFDYGTTDEGLLYLVTELLSGEPLALRLKRGPMTSQETLHVLREVLQSLHEAHERGIIHRDLKPGNIFLEEVAGQTYVKVLDFGIAKMKVKRSTDPEQPTTAEGLLLGTPAYLSPEQGNGTAVDARSDIYSLGAVAFHCLSGRVPFPGEPVAQIMAHISRPTPRFEDLDPPTPVPEPVAALVYRWMSKSPRERPASAQTALREVDALSAQLFSGATPPPPAPTPMRRGSRAASWWAALALIGVFAIIVGVGLSKRGASPFIASGPIEGTDAETRAEVGDAGAAGEPDAARTSADAAAPDAERPTDAADLEAGVQVLKRPLSGAWRVEDDVRAVLATVEATALDCYRRTQTGFERGRIMTLTFIVRSAGVSVRVQPADAAGQAYRRCLSFRLPPALPWPDREDISTAGLVIGDPRR